MEIRSKIWLEINGEPVFGSGRQNLLNAIDKYGSINRAAKEMDISYRKAFSYIKAMEDRLGIKLVERTTGGVHGGGAKLTGKAKVFLEKYELLEEGLNEFVDSKFGHIFRKMK